MNFRVLLKIMKLLIINNWRTRLHNKLSFVILFLIPVCLTSIAVLFSSKTIYVDADNYGCENFGKNTTKIKLSPILSTPENLFESIPYINGHSYLMNNAEKFGIVYTPINSYTNKLMKNFRNIFKAKHTLNYFNLFAVKDKYQLNEVLKESIAGHNNDTVAYGIEFDFDDDYEVPKHFKYKIIVLNRNIQNNDIYRNINYNYVQFNLSNLYLFYGFCQIQAAIDLAYISIVTNNIDLNNINISVQEMPIPARDCVKKIENIRLADNYFLVPLVMSLTQLLMLPIIVKRIVEEKSTKITDYLTVLGIGKTEQWISVIIDAFILLGLQSLIIAFILNIPVMKFVNDSTKQLIDSRSLLYGLDFSLFLCFAFVFTIQSILFACLISVLFKSPNIAVITTAIIWIPSVVKFILIFYSVLNHYKFHHILGLWGIESLSCLIPNFALFWFTWISIGLNENSYSGATWSHISDAGYLTDEMSIGHVLIVMLMSYPLYGLLIWYLSSIISSEETMAKAFYFPIKNIIEYFERKIKQNIFEVTVNCEGLSITTRNLSKNHESMVGFKSKHVLRNIDLDVKDKSITLIVGPNNSGKTTLMNIIIGSLDFDGEVIVGGHDISRERQLARNLIGFCPQHNVYYKWLTVREHLQLLNDLKTTLRRTNDGLSVEQLIELLDLKSDVNTEAFKLKPESLRRLVLGMALIGPNDVLLLDEPMAKLDLNAKRKVMDLIIDAKKSKSVVITSHQLEETNQASDMIVVIADGNIQFKGSILEMKKQLDFGYQLKIMISRQKETESEVREIISKYMKIKSFNRYNKRDNQQLQYGLNFEDSKQFSSMFNELETQTIALGINDITLDMTRLEDCYEKIIYRKDESLNRRIDVQTSDNNNRLIRESICFEHEPYKLAIQQIIAILIKRLNYLSKHYILFLTLIIIPIFFMSLLFVSIEILKNVDKKYIKSLELESKQIYGNGQRAFIITHGSTSGIEFSKTYSSLLEERDIIQEKFDNNHIQESLLLYSEQSLYNYFNSLLYGVSTHITNKTIDLIVWHNYVAYHSLPISMNLMTTALLRQLTNDSSYDITVSNSPLQFDESNFTFDYFHTYRYLSDYLIVDILLYMFGFAFTAASYIILPIHELRTKFKLLQFMSGLSPIVYWFANFTFDFTLHAICSLVYASVYHFFDYYEFFIASKYSFISTYLMFLLYGFSFIPFAYLISTFSRESSKGFIFLSLYNIIGGIVAVNLIAFISYYSYDDILSPFEYLISELLLILCPNTLFSTGINALHKILGYNTYCDFVGAKESKRSNCDYKFNICCQSTCSKRDQREYYSLPDYSVFSSTPSYDGCHKWFNPVLYVNPFYIRFVFYGFIYFIIIMIIEMKYFQKVLCSLKRKLDNDNNNYLELQEIQSEEVKHESQYVSQILKNGDLNKETLIVDGLTKEFKKALLLPNRLSFTVGKGECLGLLSTNGSETRTVFRLLTGDLSISSGNVYLGSNANLMTNKTDFCSRIGYCPENDQLLNKLTGMQTLSYFGRLRGIHSKTLEEIITNFIVKFDLKNIINDRLSTYSRGNRRKISLAIALTGNPELLLLEQLTNGIDLDSKLKLWQLLKDLMTSCEVPILLSSQDMEECEVLCSRLAFISNGILETFGSVCDIKRKYAKEFVIILKINSNTNKNRIEDLKTKVSEIFGDKCVLKCENLSAIYYHLASENMQLSRIFRTLESIKAESDIEQYFVSNASLRQALTSIFHQ